MAAAQGPDEIDAVVAMKQRDLDDPDMVRIYLLISEAVHWSDDHPRIVEIVDAMEKLMLRAVDAGETGGDQLDQPFVELMDQATAESSPIARRIIALLEERGWKGWTRIDQAPPRQQLG
jgi:hypothetical protein